MAFRVVQIGGSPGLCARKCAEVISAEGEITNDTADQFLAFLSQHIADGAMRPVVLLESPGGTVVGSMQLGFMFRKIGAAVIVAQAIEEADGMGARIVPGLCMSACVYALFGGEKRVVPPVSKLGIHRMVINGTERDPSGGMAATQTFGSDDIVAMLSEYTRQMGVDPSVIAYAEKVAPNSIHIVTRQQIARWRMGSPKL